MKKTKLDYTSPGTEVFVIRIERNLCQSQTQSLDKRTHLRGGGFYEGDECYDNGIY